MQTDEDLLLGETLGSQYVLDSLLGEGAMARVYRAHHAHLPQKQFAIKVMIGELSSALEMRLRFAQEADAASALDHPNVVSVVDFGKTDRGLMYLAMELVDGRSLATLIEQEAPLAPPRALEIARQIALGLEHAHARGLVHRDLKPENIIVSGAPEMPRIVDFGLAIPVDEERSTRLTRVGLVVGTPVYAAPEQTHGEAVDHRADLFALGVTLYEMLAGVVPYEGNMIDLARQNASDVLIPISARGKARVSPEIEALVRTLMRRDPAKRYQSARELITAIDACANGSAIVSLPHVPRSRTPWWIFGGAGVAVAIVIAVVASGSHATPHVVAIAEPPRPAPVATVEHRDAAIEVAAPPVVMPVEPAVVQATKPRPLNIAKQRPQQVAQVAPASPDPTPAPITPPAPVETPTPVWAGSAAPSVLPAPVKPAPVAPQRAAPLLTTAAVNVVGIAVRGPLAESEVRTAIQRGLEAMKACYRTSAQSAHKNPRVTARVSVSFDDSRRATSVHVIAPAWPAIAPCVQTAAEQLRVAVAPDVGTADVTADIAFEPVAP